jgi:hypothetical protein
MESEGKRMNPENESQPKSPEFELTKEDHIIVLNMLYRELYDIEIQIEASLTNNHAPLSQ